MAGKREGFAGVSGLALDYVRLAYEGGFRWLVWENVPGVFSSNQGRDFASFLSGLAGIEIATPQPVGEIPGLFATQEETGSVWHGECLTLNTQEWTAFRSPSPSADGVCSLSDILETGDLPSKYYLSPTACSGILRRAEKRGKSSPPLLEDALRRQAEQHSGTEKV